MSPMRGVALKLGSVFLFMVMAALIKATASDVPPRPSGILSVVLCHAGDPGLVDLAW